MSNNKIWKVYQLTSPKGRVYIGCTKLDADKRWQNGRNYKSNTELFDDIVLYGWSSFKKEVLVEFEYEADARYHEHCLIRQYPDGYNIYRAKPKTPGALPSQPKSVMCVETKEIFNSVHSAASETGLSRVKISECCNGKRKRTGGFHWKFVTPNMSL